MGIPIALYEDSECEEIEQFGWCSEACKRRLGELCYSRESTVLEEDYEERPVDDDMVYAWRFDLQTRAENRVVNLAELESTRSKDASSWIFYRPDGSETAVYRHRGREDDPLTVVHGVQELLQGSTIQSVDVRGGTLLLGLDSGQIKVVTCNNDGRIVQCESLVLRSGRILDVFAGLLPEFVIAFAADEGLLCTELRSGRTSKLLDVPPARLQRVSLDFPRLSAFGATRIWSCDDVLSCPLVPVDAPLWPGEQLLNVDPCARHMLLLETDQRYLSLDTAPAGCACTVLHKSEYGGPARAHTSTGGQQLFVSEQHLYATSLTMYGRCSRNRDCKWISLGYSDIRAKYNICRVLRLTLMTASTPATSVLALLTDDGSIHSFSIER
ncbi:hypothetical protein HG536_0E05280 [Torulaspora globosa]|uniref:Uncharacterized protein n=1 Tax=Torulaspora globosa TaxID=48254 RepID=A0A7G3ZJD1_9SACH|nr:uncharacterized protein HG536_0E05280 [Torulaspora globosa]QLL33617.1 hypothetical protein HG536_0E05280 [Torulaspora globosa]